MNRTTALIVILSLLAIIAITSVSADPTAASHHPHHGVKPKKPAVGVKKPVVKKPAVKKPAVKKPAPRVVSKKPIAKKPVAHTLPAKKPVIKKATATRSLPKKPAIKKPVAKPLTGRKPIATSKSPAKKPASTLQNKAINAAKNIAKQAPNVIGSPPPPTSATGASSTPSLSSSTGAAAPAANATKPFINNKRQPIKPAQKKLIGRKPLAPQHYVVLVLRSSVPSAPPTATSSAPSATSSAPSAPSSGDAPSDPSGGAPAGGDGGAAPDAAGGAPDGGAAAGGDSGSPGSGPLLTSSLSVSGMPQCQGAKADSSMPTDARRKAICTAALNYCGHSTDIPSTDHGKLGCAYAVSNVLKNAGVSTYGIILGAAALDGKLAQHAKKISVGEAECGDVLMEANNHHVGVCLNKGCTKVISNSSSHAKFLWVSGNTFAPSYPSGRIGHCYQV